jgi:hypothetical protein
MDNDEKMVINVQISGTIYSLTIPRGDEEKYRRAGVIVNRTIAGYKAKYKAPHENYFAMAALHASADNVEWMMKNVEGRATNELLEIEKVLDDYIANI